MLQRKHQPARCSFFRHRAARLRLEALEERLVLSTATSMPAPTALSVSATAYSSTDVLVQYQANQTPFALPGTSVGPQLALVNGLYEVNLSSGVSVAQALAAYKAAPGIAAVEPDYTLSVASAPSSPALSQQWSLQNTGQDGGTPGDDIGATQAWNNTTGSSSLIVAVLDTGVDYTHPDLYQNIWINQAAIPASRLKNLVDVYHDGYISMRDLNSPINQGPGKITDLNHNGYIDAGDLLQPMILNAKGQDTGKGGWVNPKAPDAADGLIGDLIGWNFSANSDNPYDDNGHGTHVAGIIGATGNDGGTLGIDPEVQLMAVKFLDANGHGSISQYIEGLNYAVSHGAKIINNSWTGADPSEMLIDAVGNAQSHGVIFVAAAGNDGSNNDANPVYPAGFNQTLNNVVAVAATDSNDALASFSNYGANTVNLAAPGVDIYSTVPGDKYAYDSGTSMATPEVAGVMALVWSEHTNWTDTQVIHQVLSTVSKVSDLAGKVSTSGVLNAAAAVGAVAASSTPPRVLSASASGPKANTLATIELTFDQSIIPSSLTPGDISLLTPGGKGVGITSVTPVAGSNTRTFTISFASQTSPGTYTLNVGSLAKDQAGAHITAYQKTFTIASPSRPTSVTGVSSSGPTANSLSSIQLTFNQGVDSSTFTPSRVSLLAPGGKAIPVASVTSAAGSGNRTFTISFAKQTAPGTYTLSLSTDVKDFNGNHITAYQKTFTIAAPPPPTSVTGVSSSGPSANSLSSIQVTFNQGVDSSTFTPSRVTLLAPGGKAIPVASVTPVAGSGNRTFTISFAKQTAPGTYTLSLSTDVKDFNGNHITAYQKTFTIASPSRPTSVTGVSSSGPTANSLSSIHLTFNQGVDSSTFTPSRVSLLAPGGKAIPVASVTSAAGSGNRTFTISFAKQTASTGTYTLSLSTDVKDFNGNHITAYQKTFTIAAPPPPTSVTGVSSSGPSANSLSSIQVTFNQGVDSSTFTPSRVTLLAPGGKAIPVASVTPVAGSGNRTFTISFAKQTAPGTYTLSLSTDVKDFNGNHITAYQKTFTIAAPPPPTSVTGVSSSGPTANSLSTIQLTFNQGVDSSTFTPSRLTLLAPGGKAVAVTAVTPVAGSGNRTFTISFAKQTAPGTYTLSLSTDVKDFNGNRITAYQKTFTIAAPPPPTSVTGVSSSGPSANSLSSIQVTFNQGVDSSTFTPSRVSLLAPGGKAVAVTAVTPVAGSGNRMFTIAFAKQTAPGTYTLSISTDVKDFNGNRITAYQKTFTIAAPPPPTSVTGVSNSGSTANSLSSIQVTFNQGVDSSTFTPSRVTLLAPGGKAVPVASVTPVAGSGNRTFTISFAKQTTAGTYTLYLSTDVKDFNGNRITAYQKTFTIAAPVPTVASFTSNTQVAIPAEGRGVSLLTINQNTTIGNLAVTVNIQYPRVGDLYIHLQAPDGTNIVLANRMDGANANMLNTTFNDKASTSIVFTSGSLNNGVFQPQALLSQLNGKSLQGTWKLWVENQGGSAGVLKSWTLTNGK